MNQTSVTCRENQWMAQSFEQFIAHNQKIEAGMVLSENPDAVVDYPAIRLKIMTALLECSLPAGNA